MIRVLVVDDSAVFRKLLAHVMNADPDLTVVGEAQDGLEAVELVQRLDPDVVTMDMHMPRMTGAEATSRIMQQCPRPIVIVSASVDPADVAQSFRALEAGAVSILAKPPGPGSPGFRPAVDQIVKTVKLLSQVKVVKQRTPRLRGEPPQLPIGPEGTLRPRLVAIGASTGGPSAIEHVLKDLPADFAAPIVVVQHIAEGFDQGFVDWLNRTTSLDVHLASADLALRRGRVVVAPCNKHLLVRGTLCALEDGPPIDGHQPSISQMFRSVARSFGPRALGVLLTGMGADGAAGLSDLKRAGGTTLVQDEATSVVYGMAQQAVKLGAADQILPLTEIGPAIAGCMKVTSAR